MIIICRNGKGGNARNLNALIVRSVMESRIQEPHLMSKGHLSFSSFQIFGGGENLEISKPSEFH